MATRLVYKKIMYLKRKKRKEKKIYINPHYIPHKNKNTSPIKKSYANSPSKYMTTFIPKTTFPFCHE